MKIEEHIKLEDVPRCPCCHNPRSGIMDGKAYFGCGAVVQLRTGRWRVRLTSDCVEMGLVRRLPIQTRKELDPEFDPRDEYVRKVYL